MTLRAALTSAVLLALLVLPAGADARVLYVGNAGSGEISGLSVGADGTPTPLTGSPFPTGAGTRPRGLSFTPDGRFLLHVNNLAAADGSLASSAVGAGGALAPVGTPAATDQSPAMSAVTPDGRFAYVTNSFGATPTLFGYSVSPAGVPTPLPGPGATLNGNPSGIAITPDGRHLYASGADLYAFSIGADGALAPVTGSPYPNAVPGPNGLVASPDGRFLFVIDNTGGARSFSIAADGQLTPVQAEVPTGDTQPRDGAVSPDGRYLYVSNSDYAVGSGSLSAFAIGADGALSTVSGSPFPVGPTTPNNSVEGVAITADGRYLFTTRSQSGDNIYGFTRQADGSLIELTGSPFPSGGSFASSAIAFRLAVFAPNQGPVAGLKAGAPDGRSVRFTAAGSSDLDGEIVRYDWEFGDGKSLPNGGPIPSHTYPRGGKYTATLTLTDDEGCSLTFVYTGQSPSCTGSAAARASVEVTIDGTKPRIRGLRLPGTFAVGKGKTPVGAIAVKRGAKVRFRLSERAALRLQFQRCSKQAGKRCKRWKKFGKAIRRTGKNGKNSVKFTGRVGPKPLQPGAHRLVLTATDAAGNKSKPAKRRFQIVRLRKR